MKVAVWRALPRYDPAFLNRCRLPILGALMGNDMVDPSPEDVEAAEELINARARKAKAWIERNRPDQIPDR